MLMITSDAKMKELLERGRKQRSDAFFGMLKRVLFAARRPKSDGAVEKRAAPKQCCP